MPSSCYPIIPICNITIGTTLGGQVKYGVQELGINIERKCQICGIGAYEQEGKLTPALLQLMDLPSPNKSDTRLFVCNHCGNMQQFFIPYGKERIVWENA